MGAGADAAEVLRSLATLSAAYGFSLMAYGVWRMANPRSSGP